MFAKHNRLGKTTDIQLTFARGRSFFNPFFTIRLLRKSAGASRFTIVVSTKVSKRAVRRNRLRRLIREVIKQRMTHLPIGDYIIILKPAITKISEEQMVREFKNFIAEKIEHAKNS